MKIRGGGGAVRFVVRLITTIEAIEPLFLF